MKKLTIITTLSLVVLLAGIAAASLQWPGKKVTVTPTVYRHDFGGQAEYVSLSNLGSSDAYWFYNVSTGQWATIHSTTNGILLSPGQSMTIGPGRYSSVCTETLDGATSTVSIAGWQKQ